jgi:acyl carrier protein
VTIMTIADTPIDALVGLGIDADVVGDGSTLHGDLELDSTETVQVALELTRHLGVKVSLSEIGDLPVAELVKHVVEQVETPPDRAGGNR